MVHLSTVRVWCLSALAALVLAAPAAANDYRGPVPILTYHELRSPPKPPRSPSSASLWVSGTRFSAQMRGLARAGYHGVTLSQVVPLITSGSDYRAGRTALFVTWDEDDSFSGGLCPSLHCDHLATIVVARSVRPGTRSATMFSHYSLLRTTEELIGLPGRLGQAATANSMASAFHLLRARR